MISHLDELPSRESVYLTKHCHMKSPIVYGALIMPMGNLNFAFRQVILYFSFLQEAYTLFVKLHNPSSRSDYPVPGKPHSFSHHIKFAQVLISCWISLFPIVDSIYYILVEERNFPPCFPRYEVQWEGKIQSSREVLLYHWRSPDRERKEVFIIYTFIYNSGIHMTGNAYVPTYLLKDLSATEYKGDLSLGKLFE